MKKKLVVLSSLGLVFMPFIALAANTACTQHQNLTTIQGILCKIGDILNTIVPILVVLGVVYFVWGVVQYVMASEEEAKKVGRERMIYGIIGLVVIVSMWGLVGIITNTFQLSGTGTFTLPEVPLGQ